MSRVEGSPRKASAQRSRVPGETSPLGLGVRRAVGASGSRGGRAARECFAQVVLMMSVDEDGTQPPRNMQGASTTRPVGTPRFTRRRFLDAAALQ
jgi:hypothetical protein